METEKKVGLYEGRLRKRVRKPVVEEEERSWNAMIAPKARRRYRRKTVRDLRIGFNDERETPSEISTVEMENQGVNNLAAESKTASKISIMAMENQGVSNLAEGKPASKISTKEMENQGVDNPEESKTASKISTMKLKNQDANNIEEIKISTMELENQDAKNIEEIKISTMELENRDAYNLEENNTARKISTMEMENQCVDKPEETEKEKPDNTQAVSETTGEEIQANQEVNLVDEKGEGQEVKKVDEEKNVESGQTQPPPVETGVPDAFAVNGSSWPENGWYVGIDDWPMVWTYEEEFLWGSWGLGLGSGSNINPNWEYISGIGWVRKN